MSCETLIGLDIGTTSVKAVLVDLSGRVLAEYARPYATARPRPGWVEQDPADWLRHIAAALGHFAARDLSGLCGIGFTSQVNTHVFVDADLEPLCPAIVWQDGRAAAAGARIDAGVSAAEKQAWFGAPIPIDASHVLSRMAWMAETAPDIWARTAHVLSPKDFCIARLTGVVAADPLASVGLVGADLAYVAPLIARVAGAAERLAPLRDPLARVGAMRGGPCAGAPVTLGTMDAWAAMFGLGVTRPGQAMYLSGTSEVTGLLAPVAVPTPGVIVFPEWAGLTLQAGPTQSGGAALDWLAGLLGRSVAELAVLAEGAEITAQSPLFLPHLEGERAPLWDTGARGAFAGLTTRSDPAALTLAVLEGVAFSARLAMEALEHSAGRRAPEIRLGGGGARLDDWGQIRADALGRPLRRMAGAQAAALGAAVCAGVGSGLIGSLAEAGDRLVREDRVFVPDPAAAALADRRFALFREMYAGLRPINAGLVA